MMIHFLESNNMKYVKFSVNDGYKNMEIDSELLEKAIFEKFDEPIFRLYAWEPKCVSLGRNQKEDFIKDVDIDCVRRLTGGRALLHDNEITYSYVSPISIIPNGETVINSYKYISSILIDFFKTLGVELDFGEGKAVKTKFDYCMLISTGADVCYQGKKIIGSAQFRKEGYVLQHGSILFDYDKTLLEELFKEEVSTDSITTMKEILPNFTKEEFIQKFENYLVEKFKVNL